jgi:ferredoxin
MAIKRVWIEPGCIGCKLSETLCPDVFKVDDEAHVMEGVDYTQFELQIMEAAEACPVEVIKYETDSPVS